MTHRPFLAAGLVAATTLFGTACTPGVTIRPAAMDRTNPDTISASPTSSTTTPTPTPTPSATSTTARKPAPAPRPKHSVHSSPSRAVARTPTAAVCHGIPSSVSASQVVLVDAYGASATVRACARSHGTWVSQLGPYYGHVGQRGVSWSKREGDMTTPAGTFPLRGGFGPYGNPGLDGTWFTTGSSDVWVDDPGSSLYNTHQHTPANGRWDSAEPLLKSPAYDYAQVVGYNEARTPGRGSAIFFHVDLGHGTAGCVSIPSSALRAVMRWERPGALMTITP
ncbi:MAG: L,D-transpeptidase family protein [Oryzihumus sp.]